MSLDARQARLLLTMQQEDSSKITMQATGALSWRRADIKYRKNEAFVDVIEDVNLLMSATGTVLRADVNGQIIMRAYLSGTPECKFGLNDRLTLGEDHLQQPSGNKAGAKATRAAAGSVTLEDCQFHQCVKLGKFDADRIISFVPPDGEFELMRYRATENVNLPFKVHAIVNEVGKTKVEYSIAIRANYGSKLFATNVVVRIPTPLNTARITERTSQGKAKYEPEHNNIVWKIPRFTGQSEFVLSAEASLTSMTNQKAWSRPPLNLSFSLLMFTSSGLLVRYLKVFEKSNYSSVKWVRYMTRAGNYEIRYVYPLLCWLRVGLTKSYQVLRNGGLHITIHSYTRCCIAGVMGSPSKISLNIIEPLQHLVVSRLGMHGPGFQLSLASQCSHGWSIARLTLYVHAV